MLALGDAPLDWPTWLASINLLQVAIVVCALYVVVRLLVKFWPWLRKAMRLVDALGALPKYMADTNEKISEIHHEVHYNNGSSVKDAVTRAENAVERVELGVRGLYDRMDAAEASDVQLRKDLEDTRPRRALTKEHRNGNENDDQH